MNERDFVNKKRADWDRLTALIAKAGGTQGVRVLSRDEVRELGPLYRRASSDLAQARLHATSSDLVLHLNGLVGRAHALMFEAETSRSPMQSVAHFYLQEFPALLQKRIWYFLAAVAISVLGGVFAYWLVITHPDKINLFIPEGDMKRSLDIWKSGHVAGEASAGQSGFLFANNMRVGLVAFALGGFFGIPTFILLFTNGALLGAFSAVMTQYHTHGSFWPGILPHGIAELTAIFICGAAGFLIGLSLLFPGPYHRGEAFKRYGIDGVKLALGTVPMFIFAAIIEGMFSHLPLAPGIRYAFAAANGILWYLYLFFPRPKGALLEEAELSGN
jgi:uncharacterized membrane protein SpoIIM required for sporulation